MVILSDTQVDKVCERLQINTIQNDELREDLIDHFCCFIERKMTDGFSFEESFSKAFGAVTPNGIKEIEEELFFIIHFETQLTMTRLFYVSSFVASFFSVLYFLCKGLHWPYANTFMQISFVTILLFVLPSIIYLASRNRKAMTGMDKARVTIGVLAGFLTSAGMIFKGLHFPGGGIMFVIGCFIIGFVFLPMFFFQLYQRSLQLSK